MLGEPRRRIKAGTHSSGGFSALGAKGALGGECREKEQEEQANQQRQEENQDHQGVAEPFKCSQFCKSGCTLNWFRINWR
jgi:hypothetical protein